MYLPRKDLFSASSVHITQSPSHSTSVLFKRDAPQIGGSVGGFIALVVCLVVVIIVASMGAFYLISKEADESPRHRRTRQYDHHAVPVTPSFPKSTPSPSTLTLFSRIRQYLASISLPKAKFGSRFNPARPKVEAGWVKTSSGDDWASSPLPKSRDQIGFVTPPHTLPKSARAGERMPIILRTPSPTTTIASPVSRPTSESIVSSVRFDLQAARGLIYHDPSAPSIQSSIPGIHVHYSPATSSGSTSISPPVRSASPEQMTPLHEYHSRSDITSHISSQSGFTARTFEGGSKFIEGF